MHALGITICFCLAVGPADTAGDEPAAVQARAESAFENGIQLKARPEEARAAFKEAAERYESLRKAGVKSRELFINLGNSHLLAGDLPKALLAFRMGLRLSPGDSVLASHLEYARGEVEQNGRIGRPPGESLPRWLLLLSMKLLFFSVIGGEFLACAAFVRWRITGRGISLVCFSALLSCMITLGMGARYWAEQVDCKYSIVVIANDNVTLRKGNSSAYPAASEFKLNRGAEARLLFNRGSWMQIELSGGEVGWVPASQIVRNGS